MGHTGDGGTWAMGHMGDGHMCSGHMGITS